MKEFENPNSTGNREVILVPHRTVHSRKLKAEIQNIIWSPTDTKCDKDHQKYLESSFLSTVELLKHQYILPSVIPLTALTLCPDDLHVVLSSLMCKRGQLKAPCSS